MPVRDETVAKPAAVEVQGGELKEKHISVPKGSPPPTDRKRLTIRELLKPHMLALGLGFLAVIGESIANLLEPWPLKIVLDNVLKTRPIHGWLSRLVLSTAGEDKIAILKFACVCV